MRDSDQSHLLRCWFRSTVPRLIEVGDGRARGERSVAPRRRGEAGGSVRLPPDLVEQRPAAGAGSCADELLDVLLERVDGRTRMPPGKCQGDRRVRADEASHVVELQQPRALRNEQTDRQLNRSEERRVGEGWRSRELRYGEQTK